MKLSISIFLVWFILFFMSFHKSIAQINIKQVDSISLSLYEKKQWNELTKYAATIQKNNFDFYLYNLRLGIANYELKNYESAIIYFNKSLNNNTSHIAKEYLYWSYLLTGQYSKAHTYFNQFDKKNKKKIRDQRGKKTKLLNFIYVEGGQNIQKVKSANNINYFSLGLNHELNSNITLNHSYNYTAQKLENSDLTIYRYYAKPVYNLYDMYQIGLSINYLKVNNQINYQSEFNNETIEEDVVLSDGYTYDRVITTNQTYSKTGTLNEDEIQLNVFVAKLFKKLKVGIYGGVSQKKLHTKTVSTINTSTNVLLIYEENEVYNNDLHVNDITKIKYKPTGVKYNLGTNIGYNLTDKIGLAFEVNLIDAVENSRIATNFVGTIAYKLNSSINFSANYIQKGKFSYYYNDNAYFLSYPYDAKRIGFVTGVNLTKKIDWFLVYQLDSVDNTDANTEQVSNTFLTGLKLKL